MMKLKPKFIQTANVRRFETAMAALAMADEGRFGLVYGRAGRGKTRTAQWWVSRERQVYLRALSVWASSEVEFLRSVCRELGVISPPGRKAQAFQAALDRLLAEPQRTIVIDEMEKLPRRMLAMLRDLADLSGAAIVFVGEEDLVPYLQEERRVWSRVYQVVEFGPITAADIVLYAAEVAGLTVDRSAAALLERISGGDIRLVRRELIACAQLCQGRGTETVTEEIVAMAEKSRERRVSCVAA
jgi:hypothetical protein